MQVNSNLIKSTRVKNGWTQQQLAEISDVSLRTIQRIEHTGTASNESISALSSSFGIEREKLMIVPRVSPENLKIAKLNQVFLVSLGALLFGIVLGGASVYWVLG
ncbi:MAG: helix-turn-helix domain-containing protein [Kangiellaceae bacterium]|nr:helix-turn-helix domain-containing protein [Kangiellaceae bacterium]MCW9000609.1 helix-turn-helix domain-containing protein [Kangiellaceae bacterium]